MIRTFAAAGGPSLAGMALVALAGSAAAQTWGQPVYGGAGGTPLSEVETRSYVNTGRWADGYADQAYVHAPAPVYGVRYGYGRGDDSRYGHGRFGHEYGHGRYEPRRHQGYRDVWGYDDDRHPSARGWSRQRRDDRDCRCGDVYLSDR